MCYPGEEDDGTIPEEQHQLSLYNPNVDLNELIDSPNHQPIEEPFAMAPVDPQLMNTPKIDL